MTTPLIVVGDQDMDTASLALAFLTDEPQTIARLAARCGVSRREMEQALERIATDGVHGLVADGSGVKLSTDADEIHAYTESLRRRMASMYRRVRSQRAVERRLRGVEQMEMFG